MTSSRIINVASVGQNAIDFDDVMLEKHYDGKGFMRSFFPYTREVINGELGYDLPELLFTPGTSAIAIVEAIANRIFGLEIGQKLFCDPYLYIFS